MNIKEKTSIKIINLTGVDIAIIKNNKLVKIKTKKQAKITWHYETINNYGIKRLIFDESSGLSKPKKNMFYLVSKDLFDALSWKCDLLYGDILDEVNGIPIYRDLINSRIQWTHT